MEADQDWLRAYVEYLRDLGIHDLYRRGEPIYTAEATAPRELSLLHAPPPVTPEPNVQPVATLPVPSSIQPPVPIARPLLTVAPPPVTLPHIAPVPPAPTVSDMPKPPSFNDLAPLPVSAIPASERSTALAAIQTDIGDCTRCPLAYGGRRKIVFGNGDPNARLMFVGEGPGADEDVTGEPFVGKAGQLLNNMIQAMGLRREQVYVANIVKCRPPANRVPEPPEANTCTQFLVRQIDIVQPQVIVALGATAALYLLGVKQPLAALRGHWHSCRGAKLAVTYHPAFLLRDPRQKGEAWKDLQRVMAELGLEPPKRPA